MPSTPQLSQHHIPLPNDQLVISIPDQQIEVSVDCIARGGIPAPDFSWLLNGQLLNDIANKLNPKGKEGLELIILGMQMFRVPIYSYCFSLFQKTRQDNILNKYPGFH